MGEKDEHIHFDKTAKIKAIKIAHKLYSCVNSLTHNQIWYVQNN